MREIFLYLLFGPLLLAGIGSACVPIECLKCNATGGTLRQATDSCSICPNVTVPCVNVTSLELLKCRKDFKVTINSSGSEVNEGDQVTLRCLHDLPNVTVTFHWFKIEEKPRRISNRSVLVLRKVFPHHSGEYRCNVRGPCGPFESLPHGVTVNNNSVVLLVICGVAALVLVVLMGLGMKYKLKRDNAKHKERMRQRAQAGQSNAPAPMTPRES